MREGELLRVRVLVLVLVLRQLQEHRQRGFLVGCAQVRLLRELPTKPVVLKDPRGPCLQHAALVNPAVAVVLGDPRSGRRRRESA